MLALLIAAAAIQASLDPAPAVTGACNPTRVHFSGRIAADAPTKVTYTWVRVNQPAGRTYTLNFDKAGAAPVTYDVLLRKSDEGWVMLRVVFPERVESAKVKYKVTCK